MVTSGSNHNKFYRQIPHGDTWTAEYGRVGSSVQRREYPMSQWDKKYNEKIKKGYVDRSDIMQDLSIKNNQHNQYKQIEDQSISEIVKRLQEMAHQAISDNYTVSSNSVTQAMIDEAQHILIDLTSGLNLEEFNNKLITLFSVIPRKMSNVSQYLAKSQNDFSSIIQAEQDLLDVMKGQVIQKSDIDNDNTEIHSCTILEHLGLEFEKCTDLDIVKIKSSLGSCQDKFYNAWRVINLKTQQKFDDFVKKENISNTKLLWHGSRNENWWSIIQNGLVLNPTNAVITGKMFGMGTYFAPKAKKSLGYTSIHGSYWARGSSQSAFMGLMDVAYGTPFDVYSFNDIYHSMNYENLQKCCPGANVLHAHAGNMLRNDEIVIYKEDQVTIKYLVELR